MYYNFTRLDTRGALTTDDRGWEVAGTIWMDHEFSSNQLIEEQTGWDWFGLRLDDGRDLMLYELRTKDGAGAPFFSGSVPVTLRIMRRHESMRLRDSGP